MSENRRGIFLTHSVYTLK